MPKISSGVFPVHKNQFQVGATVENMTPIADMESFSVSFDNSIENWTPFESEGWQRGLMTGKSVTISVSGKRNIGDTGNDFVANFAFKNGREAEGCFKWTFPDGTTVLFENAIFSVTALGTGDSTGVGGLEFDVQSNGKPVVTLPTD